MSPRACLFKTNAVIMAMLCFFVPVICSGGGHVVEPISKEEVLVIAEKYVRERNESWSQFVLDVELEGLSEDGDWMVIIWRIPRVVGGFRYIEIDREGNVVLYDIGY